MKAVVIKEHGGPEVLQWDDVPDPVLGPDDVLVKVKACALNHLDLWVRRGIPGAPFKLPMISGSDVSGDIATVGANVTDLAPGLPVMVIPGVSCGQCGRCESGQDQLCRQYHILGETRPGGMAEYVAVPRVNVVAKPANISYEDAAAVSLSFLTAWHMVVGRGQLEAEETILIHAAGSGVGSAAIQIAKLLGATIITTAGSEKKLALARKLGAHHTINYREEDFVDRVKEITQKRGVDVVIEHVGGETFERSLRCLAWAGRLVTCGATTGIKAEINLRHIFFKSQSILGSTMGSRTEYLKLVELYAQGLLRPVIDRVIKMSEASEGHRVLEAREAFGKVVLLP
jgi:NADPH:quinone reductase-like Zn-dependent oxidoreductase